MSVSKKKTTKKKVAKKKATKKTTKKKVVKKKPIHKLPPKERAEAYAEKGVNTPSKYNFGRPSEYCDSYPEKVYDACVSGECKTIASICCLLDICRDTYKDWQAKHKHFSLAIKRGTEYRKKHMEDKGLVGMNAGKQFNAIPWLFLVKNMFPDEYKDRQEVEVGNKGDETFKFAFDLSDKPEG